MSAQYQVIYVTGQPAVGKTTLVDKLIKAYPKLIVIKYSDLLEEYLTRKMARKVSHISLREHSAKIITYDDIAIIDKKLIADVEKLRSKCHILIDSHPTTKEEYGFRVTAFSIPVLKSLKPTRICMLYAEPNVIIKRIAKNKMGRALVNSYEAQLHFALQANVAVVYGIEIGVPIYFFDASQSVAVPFNKIIDWLK